MNFLFSFLIRAAKRKPEEVNPTPTIKEPLIPTDASSQLSNEANVIADIRSKIPQLKALGIQNRRNHLIQSQEYINDIDAPAKPSRFTELEEANVCLRDEYDLIVNEIIQQIGIYDRYCDRHQLAYSVEWNKLLTDLRWYLGGIGSGGALHLEEAAKGFEMPSSDESNLNG